MTTHRLQFRITDRSLTEAPVLQSPVIGGIVLRGAKGNNEPILFPPNSESLIRTHIGLPNASYADIQEAIEFNRQFSLEISSPPGSSAEYPSYFGGAYLTKFGFLPFYKQQKGEDNFMTGIPVGKEAYSYTSLSGVNSTVTPVGPNFHSDLPQPPTRNSILIGNIHSDIFRSLQTIDFNYWGQTTKPTSQKIFSLKKVGDALMIDDGSITGGAVIGRVSPETNDLHIEGTASEGSVMFIDFEFLLSSAPFRDSSGEWVDEAAYKTELAGLIKDRLFWIINVQNDTYCSFKQNSPTEQPTRLSFSHIGYDKIRYDLDLPIFRNEMVATGSSNYMTIRDTGRSDGLFFVVNDNEEVYGASGLYEANSDASIAPLNITTRFKTRFIRVNSLGVRTPVQPTSKSKASYEDLMKSNIEELSIRDDVYRGCPNCLSSRPVTSDMPQRVFSEASRPWVKPFNRPSNQPKRKYLSSTDLKSLLNHHTKEKNAMDGLPSLEDSPTPFLIGSAVMFSSTSSITSFSNADTSHIDELFLVSNDLVPKILLVDREVIKAVEDTSFNTLTFRQEEEVNPGEWIGAPTGTTTGSLNVDGKNQNGQNNFLQALIPTHSLNSFISVKVYKTFDADVSAAGFFMGSKAIDAINGPVSASFDLVGQRWMNHAIRSQEERGIVGGAPDLLFLDALTQGWEALIKSKIKNCHVALEPTGIEPLKTVLANARASKEGRFTTFISNRILTQVEKLDLRTVRIIGRSTGVAQYINRALVQDNSGRRYYSTLIGSVGVKLAVIIRDGLGGVAPMGTDWAGGMGGQLDRDVIEMEWEGFTEEDTEVMDNVLAVNPIFLLDAPHGLSIWGHRTTRSTETTSDWSYLAHSMSFDLVMRELASQVMIPQIGKANNDFWRSMRQEQANRILRLRTAGTNPIWSFAAADTSSAVNTREVLSHRKFAIDVQVRVFPTSEIVVLDFSSLPQ